MSCLILWEIEQMQQPSALDMFEQITNASKGKQIVMFMDYDGTLSPIVDDPDQAFMSEAVSIYSHYTYCMCFYLQLHLIINWLINTVCR